MMYIAYIAILLVAVQVILLISGIVAGVARKFDLALMLCVASMAFSIPVNILTAFM